MNITKKTRKPIKCSQGKRKQAQLAKTATVFLRTYIREKGETDDEMLGKHREPLGDSSAKDQREAEGVGNKREQWNEFFTRVYGKRRRDFFFFALKCYRVLFNVDFFHFAYLLLSNIYIMLINKCLQNFLHVYEIFS